MQAVELPETSELLTFASTVEAGSIARAAQELGVPRPTISRRLARLEEKLGVRLLRRTTRSMVLTDAGEILLARARAVLAALRDADASVRRRDDVPRGLLRVSVPPFQGTRFPAMLADFLGRHPEVRLEVDTTTRHVDLAGGGFDVAIRATAELPPGLVARTLARSRLLGVASPAYLAQAGVPRRVSELSRHRCLAGFERGDRAVSYWPLLPRGRVRIDPLLASNDLQVLAEAACSGRGIALLPEPWIRDALASLALVPVLPARLGAETRVSVVFSDREFVPASVRAFVDAAVAWARVEPAFVDSPSPVPAQPPAPPRRGARARG